jgi:hypothetical protein
MVEMYLYEYVGEDNGWFTKNSNYIGRRNKAGEIMAKNNIGYWVTVDSFKLTISRLKNEMQIIEKFYVRNHKEAINYKR